MFILKIDFRGSELDALAMSNPKKLMNAELDWLIKSMGSRDYFFFKDKWNNWDNKTEESKMNFTKFKTSTKSAYDLVLKNKECKWD